MRDASLVRGRIGDTCGESIKTMVLTKARKLSDTANVQGIKLVYGGDATYGSVATTSQPSRAAARKTSAPERAK